MSDIIIKATGNEYNTDQKTTPQKPYIDFVKPNNLVRIPLLPNKIIRPMPCDIEGINIGKVINTVKKYLSFICVLLIAQAKPYAKTIDISVAAIVDVNELTKQV